MITRTLRRGMPAPDSEVAEWQGIIGTTADGNFGPRTEKATIQWQLSRGLDGDGVVGAETRGRLYQELASPIQPIRKGGIVIPGEPGAERWPFMQAATWKWLDRTAIRLIVLHTMESSEKPDIAEAVAAWFAGRRGPPPVASAHFCCDSDSGVRCVLARHQAAAAPGTNRDGYHIEHAGRARQSAEEWADAASTATLDISTEQAARVATMYDIPLRHLTVAEVADGVTKGFGSHYDVTRAFKKSTHTDPGEYFPWNRYLGDVEAWQKRLAA